MIVVGYQLQYPDWRTGEKGIYFNYILGSNGLFIEASNPVLSARIPVADCPVRGLAPVTTRVALTYGSIPQLFFDMALNVFLVTPDKEQYVGVKADAGYHIYSPVQAGEKAKVDYEVGDSVILDMHSHPKMPAFFSPQDDKDEQGLKISVVVGRLDKVPMVLLRVGVYGYFYELEWKDIFDGTLTGAVEFDEEEVILEDEVHGQPSYF